MRLFDGQGQWPWIGALLLLLAVPVAIMAAAQVADYDFWWNVNLGRQIWQSGTPWVADAFSFTFAGASQVNSEWLADLLLYGTFAGGGWWGIVILKALAQADVQRNPANQEPRLALVYLLYSLDRRGYGAAIERELQTCLTLQPDLAQEHSALGMLYLKSGRHEGALREARLALALDPDDPGAKFLKGKLGL